MNIQPRIFMNFLNNQREDRSCFFVFQMFYYYTSITVIAVENQYGLTLVPIIKEANLYKTSGHFFFLANR